MTGKYLVTATIQAVSDPGAANDWNVWIKKQSTTDYGRQRSRSTTGAGYVNVSDVVDLAAGEYIEIWSRQNSGGCAQP